MKQGGAGCCGHSVEQAAIFDPLELAADAHGWVSKWTWGTLLI
jgi:hypothetical protein